MDIKKFWHQRKESEDVDRGFWMIFSAAWLVLALHVFITPYPWALIMVACLLFCAGCIFMVKGINPSVTVKILVGVIMFFAILLSALYSVPILMYGSNVPSSWVARSTAGGVITCPPPEYSIVQGIELSLQKGLMNFTLTGNCLWGTSVDTITAAGLLQKGHSNDIFMCSNCLFPGYIMCDVDEINLYCYKSSDFCGQQYSYVVIDGNALIPRGGIDISGNFFDVHVRCFKKDSGKTRCDLYFEGVEKPKDVHGYREFLGYEQGDKPVFSNETTPFGYFIKSSDQMFLYDEICDDKYSGGKEFYEVIGEINVTEKQVLFREELSERWLNMTDELGRELTTDELEALRDEIASELSIKPMMEVFKESYNHQINNTYNNTAF